MAMMISWVAPVHPSHPYLENDPAPSFAPTICAFHLGFSLVERQARRRCRFLQIVMRIFVREHPRAITWQLQKNEQACFTESAYIAGIPTNNLCVSFLQQLLVIGNYH